MDNDLKKFIGKKVLYIQIEDELLTITFDDGSLIRQDYGQFHGEDLVTITVINDND